MDIYTLDSWKQSGTFNAKPGQEITQEIYDEMLNCMPPKTLPAEKAQEVLTKYRLPIHAGFLMGEPHSSSKEGLQYLAFGMNDYGKGPHFYYLGLSGPVKRITDGEYYHLETMSALENDGFFPAAKFGSDREAIKAAADYEATLYRYTYKNGERTSSTLLYVPICQ